MPHYKVKAELQHWYDREQKYIMWGNLNFAWLPGEIKAVKDGWESGMHVADIAQSVYRDQREVVMLIWDLAERGKLRPRAGGVFGLDFLGTGSP